MLTLENAANPQIISASWNAMQAEQPSYLSQTNMLQITHTTGNTVEAVYGAAQGLRGLDLTAADVSSNRLKNKGFTKATYTLAEFKNHVFVDERTRRMVNEALVGVSSQDMANMITNTQQQQVTALMNDALVTRELMFTEALTTGEIHYQNDGLTYDLRLPMDPSQKIQVATPWGNKDSSVTDDIDSAITTLDELNGGSANIAHAIMNRKTFRKLFKSGQIINTLGINSVSNNVATSAAQIKTIFSDATGIDIQIYDKGIAGHKFIPDGKVILVPDGQIGKMAWTESNEALGNVGNSLYQTSTTADGISLTTSRTSDPAGLKYLVSENALPVIESIRNVGIMDVGTADNQTSNNSNGGSNGSTSGSGSNSGKDSGK